MMWSYIQTWWRTLCGYLEILYFELDEVTRWDLKFSLLEIIYLGKKDEMDILWPSGEAVA